MSKQKFPLTERLKEIHQSRSSLPLYEITRYIRAAGYYTKIHTFNYNFIAQSQGFEITGAKERKNLKYESYRDEVKPDVVIAVSDMNFLGRQCSIDIICPPDENLIDLEIIVRDTLDKMFNQYTPEKDVVVEE